MRCLELAAGVAIECERQQLLRDRREANVAPQLLQFLAFMCLGCTAACSENLADWPVSSTKDLSPGRVSHDEDLAPRLRTYCDVNGDCICPQLIPRLFIQGEEALNFSSEILPRYFYELNGNQLPFGCHGWECYVKVFREPCLLNRRVPCVWVFYGAPPLLCCDVLIDSGDYDGAPVRVVPEQRHAVAIASVPATE